MFMLLSIYMLYYRLLLQLAYLEFGIGKLTEQIAIT
jgi:hypothetical protein